MLLSDATVGCNAVEASRKLVPDQKACNAVPPRSVLIVGKATESVVASKATARPRVLSARKASLKSHVGLKTGLSSTISTRAELWTVGVLYKLGSCTSGASFSGDVEASVSTSSFDSGLGLAFALGD